MVDKSIRATSDLIDEISVDWEMIDALMEGTDAMRQGGPKWLPRWPMEDEENYKIRLGAAVLHPVFKRTVLVNAARPFAKPVSLGESPSARIEEWADDIDLQGSNLGAFCVRLMVACLAKGYTGVLVDYPRAEGIKTRAQETQAGTRPYLVEYPAGTILGFKTKLTDKGLQLTQLRLLELPEEDDGAFGTKKIEQVRLLGPGSWATYRENPKNKEEWLLHEEGKTTLDVIPFVFFYGIRKAFGAGVSPLLDLAFQNVEHYQSASDQQTILHVARVPILFARCFEEGQLVIGAGAAAQSTNEKSELKYVEHTGAAIEAGAKSMTALEDRMRATGAELISLDPGFATATEVSADSEATKSLLQQIAENFEESIEECLDLMSFWVKEEPSSEVEVYKDFGIGSGGDVQALTGAVGSKSISRQTHFEELQRRDLITGDRTWDDEKQRIAEEATETTNQEAMRQKALAAAGGTSSPGN